jgi:hypothetical protein
LSIRTCAKFIDRFVDHCFGRVTHRSLHKVVNCLERSASGLGSNLNMFRARACARHGV